LINDILDLSKIEAGKMSLDLESVEIASLLTNALSMIKEKALAHRLRLSLEIDEPLAAMQVDARKLKQIVYNLLSNAVKFTRDGGSVTLKARRVAGATEDELEIVVTDTGIGIALQDQSRLFQSFVQLDSSFAKNFEGTGLGLAMVKRLAELHGGRVALTSELDKGTSVTVWLPYRTDEADKSAPTKLLPPNLMLKRAKPLALIIEDKDEAAKLLRLQLEEEGLEVLRAADAETGLALALAWMPDVITLDVLLPGMDGWDFLAALKMDTRIASIPVVIVSIVADEKRGLSLGAALVLQKPVDREQLSAALAANGLLTQPGRTITALVVDDDPKAVEILSAYLEAAGCQVVRAFGGRDAVAQARSVRPDLIILDLMMPEVSGFDVVEALKADAATRAIPIIVMTAKVVTSEDRAALNGHVVRVLQKSEFNREGFLKEMRAALAANGAEVQWRASW
jgi:CheY-like chemotaxis protein/anti-sigma regulatory factor (Ser/Thr protein kinase)